MSKFIMPGLIIILTLAIILSLYKSQDLKRAYEKEVSIALKQTKQESNILTEEDIKHLPDIIQKYIIYTGVLGKEKVNNVRAVTEGKFKPDPKKKWSRIKTSQYNFFEDPTRIYFLNLKMFGLPVLGLHSYSNASANMLIKLGGLIAVAENSEDKMTQAETVTVFNDMCLLAPGSLIDNRIKWKEIDDKTVKAYFKNDNYEISADLIFNDNGQLINFISDDRYYSPNGNTYQKARWSTPVKEYRETNGMMLPYSGEGVWNFPEGDYCYAKLNFKEIEYNCYELKGSVCYDINLNTLS